MSLLQPHIKTSITFDQICQHYGLPEHMNQYVRFTFHTPIYDKKRNRYGYMVCNINRKEGEESYVSYLKWAFFGIEYKQILHSVEEWAHWIEKNVVKQGYI